MFLNAPQCGVEEKGKMSLTYYDYEAEMSDFADDLAGAIRLVKNSYPALSWDHKRYDDGNIAIIHERRGTGSNWEHIAYGYYLKYNTSQTPRVRFWIGKIIYPPTHQPPNLEIGIWADGDCSKIIPKTISYRGRDITAKQLTPSQDHFWDLPAGVVSPYDDSPPSQWGAYNNQNRNAQSVVQTVADFLDVFLAAIP
jgi:hypothetical protein